jgi:hypothetical protein
MSTQKPLQVPLSPEQVVANALNEQGFLFAQIVREKICNRVDEDGDAQNRWGLIASEYPVTASDGSQTRIDLVLGHGSQRDICLAVECKRANPLYKRWVFFDKANGVGASDQSLFLETVWISQRPVTSPLQITHSLKRFHAANPCHVYNYYLEAALDRQNQSSATKTIEEAFQQVVKGQSGLMAKMVGFDSGHFLRAIPVVVTTADLIEAQFDQKRISLRDGRIEANELKLATMAFCAVNYHADDKLALQSTTNPMSRTNIQNDVQYWQTRTVFVVQSQSVNHFLRWAADYLIDRD